MTNLIIFGESDDLIEIYGAIRDEFNHYDGPATITVEVDDAVHLIASAEHDRDRDGCWRIEVAGSFPDAVVSWVKAIGDDGPDQVIDGYRIPAYSDMLTVHLGDITPRRIGVSYAKATR